MLYVKTEDNVTFVRFLLFNKLYYKYYFIHIDTIVLLSHSLCIYIVQV